MGHYNFDRLIDRSGTNSSKYTFDAAKGKTPDMIPLWVADMDFQVPDEVIERLKERCDHGIFGYTTVGDGYIKAVQGWFEKRFGWHVEPEWMIRTPGVVYAVNAAINALTEEGDAILIQSPVYHPFNNCIVSSKRRTVRNPLLFDGERYTIDFEDFEKKIVEEKVKLFILCSPHNPVGRVWTRDELTRMGEICLKHGVFVISDEIHCDFVYSGHVHTPFASICEEFAQNSITCTAPSKTFNLAGLQTSNIFIKNEEVRGKIKEVKSQQHCGDPTIFGLVACQAAYECGEQWLNELNAYLEESARKVSAFFAENLPQIKVVKPEGTYLLWLDCRGLPIPAEEVDKFMLEKAKVWFNDGSIFGAEGVGFERMNIGAPWSVLEKACKRIAEAAKAL